MLRKINLKNCIIWITRAQARESERDRAPLAFLRHRSPLSGSASPLSRRNIFLSLDDDCGKSINYFLCKFWEKLLYGLKILHAQAGSTILNRTSGIAANTFSSIAPSLMIESQTFFLNSKNKPFLMVYLRFRKKKL